MCIAEWQNQLILRNRRYVGLGYIVFTDSLPVSFWTHLILASILGNIKAKTRPRGYKTFVMINPAEIKIYPAHKCLKLLAFYHLFSG